MIKLTDILNEARVVPVGMTNKQKIIDNIWNFNPYFLYGLIGKATIKDWIETHGYDESTSLSKFLQDEWNYKDENLKEATQLIETYFKSIKPEDIKIANGKTDISGYKHIEEVCPEGDDDCYVIITKF
jgi:hypothetical protein